jgi:hypothetical protein
LLALALDLTDGADHSGVDRQVARYRLTTGAIYNLTAADHYVVRHWNPRLMTCPLLRRA